MKQTENIDQLIIDLNNAGEYSLEKGRKYIYVCKNNGAFTRSKCSLPGYASFIGRFDEEDFLDRFGK
jgi:hypothetical protein